MSTNNHPLHILVVDDEPDLEPLIRQKFRRRVRKGDLVFTFAADGLDALEKLEADPLIDVVLTDINMPRMDGLALLARIGELERLLKSVVVTAYGDMQNIRTAMNRGAFDFLTKPIDLEDLEITINKAQEQVALQKKAEQVRATFGRYLSDDVVSVLLEQPEALKLGGEKRKLSILMSDLRGFSNISERFPPERVVEFLNIYLGYMADVITTYNGTIDEFIGDAILVIFGAPFLREDDASRAVACAVAMQQAMKTVNAELADGGFPALEMGIGINTGEVVVGNIGSAKRTKYGVVGSHVNLTGRIESYTVGGQILISESTLREAGEAVEIGKEMKLSAKGFSEPISIFEVEGIGAPFHLKRPAPADRPARLAEPWSFHYTILDGKHMTGETASGDILHLSPSSAIIRTTHPLELMSNLNLHLSTSDAPDAHEGELYAKVVEAEAETYKIRFTAVPEDVAAAIHERCG